MDPSSLQRYLRKGIQIVRRNGAKSLLDPVKSYREFSDLSQHRKNASILKKVDFSSQDLLLNQELMKRFQQMKNIQIGTVVWFIPNFQHAYGGITTIFRFADYFRQNKGIKNTFAIYGEGQPSILELKNKIANYFPSLDSDDFCFVDERTVGILPYSDIGIATRWDSAFLLLRFNNTMGKFYFIQDYEPLFYPAGAIYASAEATYRFGFYGIVNTPGLYETYKINYGDAAQYFIPSIDRTIFYPSNRKILIPSSENPLKIFFYARPSVSRNAFELGISALAKIKAKFGKRVRIYSAGSGWSPQDYDLGDSIINLGTLPYEKTADLYRKCDLGIVFMFTKHPSYLPFELMACGCAVLSNKNSSNSWFLKDGENCLLCEPSITSVCEKVEMLIDNLDLRERLISNGINSVGKSEWNDEIEKIFHFITLGS